APELATAALAYGDGDGGARILARRRAACVRVHGTTRAGLSAASLLWAAGIGLVVSTGPGPAGPGVTGGAPSAGPAPGGPAVRDRRRPDLVILADTHGRELPDALRMECVPHLAAAAS